MKYFKGFERDKKPFIVFCEWAKSLAELEALGAQDDPLILPEDQLPVFEFGVYPIRIVDGQFVEWDAEEMDDFQEEYNKKKAIADDASRLSEVNADYFTYSGKNFPMDEMSRLFYNCINQTATNHKVRTSDNEAYALNESDRAAFYAAYIAKLLLLTKHTV